MSTRIALLVGSLIALPAFALLSLRVGAAGVSWHAFIHAFTHDTNTTQDVIVRRLRGPRMFVCIEVGAALAVAGVLLQGITRNPLADPGILGIDAGASFFVVLGIAVFGAATPSQFVWFAFPGAALALALGSLLALLGRGRMTPLKLTLAGSVVASIFGALTSLVIFLTPSLESAYRFWIVGDVGGRNMSVVYATAPAVVVGLLLALPAGRSLNALALGEDLARGLGQRVALTRAAALLAVVLLAGAAVAAAGPIAFVGIAVPNAVRTVVGNDYRWLLPLSALLGATFLLAADIVGRTIVRPAEIETGIVIAAVGAPIFVLLVSRRRLARV